MHHGNHIHQPGFGATKLDHRNLHHSDIKQEYGHRSIPALHGVGSSMERGITDNPQGLPTPDSSHDGPHPSKASSADPTPAVGYVTQQEGRPGTYSTSGTPTSEYGLYPDSARSGSFTYAPAANHTGLHHNHAGLQHGTVSHSCANPPCGNPNCGNPACASHPANTHHPANTGNMAPASSNPPVPTPSPSYAPAHYPPFQGPPHGLAHGYQNPGASGMYAQHQQPRPDWGATYGAQTSPGAMPPGSGHHHVFQQAQPPVPPASRPNQVYSFVPIPGAQQTKRPRRRWEDIERMYMCNHPLPGGGNCQKAYGTLNHLNAHVQMQHHGPKRTPEEFKEIRKEWKARKKEEENKRKQAEEQQRQAQAAAQPRPDAEPTQVPAPYPRSQLPLPPMGYGQPQPYATPTSMAEYPGNSAYAPYPYTQAPQGGQGGAASHPMYQSPNGGQQN
ncbi:putative transcriptional regulator [Podospora conica]|nr:putative transcriptional regulator [Schizothecium conicum]